jgi:hypothetical protein
VLLRSVIPSRAGERPCRADRSESIEIWDCIDIKVNSA